MGFFFFLVFVKKPNKSGSTAAFVTSGIHLSSGSTALYVLHFKFTLCLHFPDTRRRTRKLKKKKNTKALSVVIQARTKNADCKKKKIPSPVRLLLLWLAGRQGSRGEALSLAQITRSVISGCWLVFKKTFASLYLDSVISLRLNPTLSLKLGVAEIGCIFLVPGQAGGLGRLILEISAEADGLPFFFRWF